MNGLSSDKRQQIETLLRAGLSDRDVHRETGAARTTVARYRKRLGLPGWQTTADSPACRHGHPFPANLARTSEGWIWCRECKRIRDRARYVPAEPDDAAVERAVFGDPPDRLTPRERRAAITRLDRRDYSAAVIAERVRCSPRTVHRARSRAAA